MKKIRIAAIDQYYWTLEDRKNRTVDSYGPDDQMTWPDYCCVVSCDEEMTDIQRSVDSASL